MAGHEAFSHYYLPRLYKWTRATILSASDDEVGDDRIVRLSLRNKDMCDSDCFHLAEALHCNATLTELDFAENDSVTTKGVTAIVAAVENHPCLKSLVVASDRTSGSWAPWSGLQLSVTEAVDAEKWVEMATLFETAKTVATNNPNISSLVLPAPPPSICGGEHLEMDGSVAGAAYRRTKLACQASNASWNVTQLAVKLNADAPQRWKHVALAANGNFTEVATAEIPHVPELDGSIESLHTGLSIFCRCLEACQTIVRLNLSDYGEAFGDGGAAMIGRVLRTNSTLAEITIRNNHISCHGAIALADALDSGNNASLIELDLTGNSVSDQAAHRFLHLVAGGKCSVGYVALDGNCVSPVLAQRLHQALTLHTQPPKLRELAPLLAANDRNLRRVALNSGTAKLDDTSCRLLLQALRTNTSLTHLDVSNNRIGDEGANHLAGIVTQCASLKRLIAQYNTIADSGAVVLMGAMTRSATVEHVDLRNQTPELSKSVLERLDWLSALGSQPYDVKAKGLMLSQNDPSVTELELTAGDGTRALDADGIKLLLGVLGENRAVRSISLRRGTAIGAPKLIPLLTGSVCARLSTLNLPDNGLSDDVAKYFFDTLSNPQHSAMLRSIDLSGNDFSSSVAHEFARVLREFNDLLTSLDLTRNQLIGPDELDEVKRCCELNTHDIAFKNLVLRIGGNKSDLREANLTQFEKVTPMGTSHHFARRYGPKSARLLAVALERNTSLTSLSLAGHEIGDEGARHLAEMLKVNVGLTSLNLTSNDISDEGLRALNAAVIENHQLRILVVSGNRRLADPALQRALALSLQSNTAAAQTDGSDSKAVSAQPSNAAIYSAALATKREGLRRAAHEERLVEKAIMSDAMADMSRVLGSKQPTDKLD